MRAPLLSSAFLSSANSGPSGWAARRWHGALLRVEAGTLCSLPGTRAYRRKFGVSRERNRPNVDGNARQAEERSIRPSALSGVELPPNCWPKTIENCGWLDALGETLHSPPPKKESGRCEFSPKTRQRRRPQRAFPSAPCSMSWIASRKKSSGAGPLGVCANSSCWGSPAKGTRIKRVWSAELLRRL